MLLRFSVENFRSFKERVEFSMIPSKVTSHKHHVISAANRSDIGALKLGVIYGANASGKTNLVKAMAFAQHMIVDNSVRGGKRLPFEPFELDSSSLQAPSKFEFEIKCGDVNYAYGFVADHNAVHEEWLFIIDKNKEEALFERTMVAKGGSEFDLRGLESRAKNQKQKLFLQFTSDGTPLNRLFLAECVERNLFAHVDGVELLREVFDWFDNRLQITFPHSKYAGLGISSSAEDGANDALNRILRDLDTGVEGLAFSEVDFDTEVPGLSNQLKEDIKDNLEEGHSTIFATPKNRYFINRTTDGRLKAHKLMARHKMDDGSEALIDFIQESDGTQRLLDLAPTFLTDNNAEKVCVIDEVDRSLHAEISSYLLNKFVQQSIGQHSQLIVTTHETHLLNLNLLRRDEVWFVNKSTNGHSKIYSLEEYKARHDKDIQRDYLAGRYGALPKLHRAQATPEMDNLDG